MEGSDDVLTRLSYELHSTARIDGVFIPRSLAFFLDDFGRNTERPSSVIQEQLSTSMRRIYVGDAGSHTLREYV